MEMRSANVVLAASLVAAAACRQTHPPCLGDDRKAGAAADSLYLTPGGSAAADGSKRDPLATVPAARVPLWPGTAPAGGSSNEVSDAAMTVFLPPKGRAMGEKTNRGTQDSLLGPGPQPELIALYSNELHVTDQTPRAFLAHAKDETPVPPENSRGFRDALQAHTVAVEYLELPSGGHGLYGCKGLMWEAWRTKALEWLAAQGIIPER